MDNDNEVKDLVPEHSPTDLFLSQAKTELAKKELYDLDTEYAKSRRNRSWYLFLWVGACVVLFAVTAFAITRYIEWQNSNIPINIEAFKDVNLREVLDKAREYENELQEALRALSDLRNKLNSGIEDAEKQFERDRELLATKNLSEEDLAAEEADLAEVRDQSVADLHEHYDPLIAEQERIVAMIEEKIASYDTRAVEQARQQEEQLNNQQRRFELEMDNTVAYYEDKISSLTNEYNQKLDAEVEYRQGLVESLTEKYEQDMTDLINLYNPEFKEEEILALFRNPFSDRETLLQALSGSLSSSLYSQNVVSAEEIAEGIQLVRDGQIVFDRLGEIPYIGSIPESLAYIEGAFIDMVIQYRTVLDNTGEVLELNDRLRQIDRRRLSQFESALDLYLGTSYENGIIIDPYNSEEIIVYLDPLFVYQESMRGYVFRHDDDYIGQVEFYLKDNEIAARLVSLKNDEREIRPFDLLLLDFQ